MTNEQAIEVLEAVKFIIEDYADEMEEAFDMAINALKAQQAAGDAISRSAALKACYNGWNKDYREIAQDIKDLPPVQPELAILLQWIETQIEWLKSLDNAFATLTARQISAMVNNWKDEQNG